MALTSTLEVGLRVHDQYGVPDSNGIAWLSETRHLLERVSSVGNPTLLGDPTKRFNHIVYSNVIGFPTPTGDGVGNPIWIHTIEYCCVPFLDLCIGNPTQFEPSMK